MISVDEKWKVFPMKLKLEENGLEKDYKKRKI